MDLLIIKSFLDTTAITKIIEEMRSSHAAAATVYGGTQQGGGVDTRVRKVARLSISEETREWVKQQLMQKKEQLEQRFGIPLTHCEDPQFLRYETGHFFVAHQDGNTPMIYDHTRFRKVSVSLYLSQQTIEPAPNSYGAGELVLHGHSSEPKQMIAEPPGTLVAFRSETTHEVLPITHGERYTIVSWFRNDEPRSGTLRK
jgi:SM-20-related protein